jgi:hypothetical protein
MPPRHDAAGPAASPQGPCGKAQDSVFQPVAAPKRLCYTQAEFGAAPLTAPSFALAAKLAVGRRSDTKGWK